MSQLMRTLLCAIDTAQQEEEVQALQAAKEAVRAAEQHLTYQEFEDLWNAISNIERAEELDCFTLGFRLGVQLILEGLRPAGELSGGPQQLS